MSEQASGHRFSDKQVEEEGHENMQNQALERLDSHVFLSSKNDSIVNAKSSNQSFDDELVTWLQYPLDDCPDIFQHWPPTPPPPTPPPPLALSTFSALASSSTSNSKCFLQQQETDAFMMTLAPERPLQAADGRKTSPSFATANVVSEQASRLADASIGLKGEGVVARQDSQCSMHEVGSTSIHAIQPARPDDVERQHIPTECRRTTQRELYLQEEPKFGVAREARLATGSSSQSKQANAEMKTAEMQKMASAHSEFLPPLQPERRSSSPYRVLKEPAQANPAADAALALGAGRAAGAIKASGIEAFNKVRTSSHSLRPFKLGSPPLAPIPTSPSGKGISDGPSSPTMLPPKARPVGFRAVLPLNQRNSPLMLHSLSQAHFINPCTNVSETQEHQFMVPMKGNENSSKRTPVESSMTASVGSQGTKHAQEDADVPSSSRAAAFEHTETPDIQKLSGMSSLGPEKRDVTISGDSETSESLKETFSGSKRRLEDSECHNEDAEDESAVNSQTRNGSSKRTRTNEVHNLSERRRRNRINDKMNALRELIPNASKTNKAALLDEAIDYLKNLQLQLQVMSVRTGMSLSPMVVPPGLPHMQAPHMSPLYPVGMGTLAGSSTGVVSAGSAMGLAMCNMTCGVPARPFVSARNPVPWMLQPPEKSSFSQLQPLTAPEMVPLHYPHSYMQTPSQPMFSVNVDMCNNYLQQQHQQQQQRLQRHPHNHEQQASPQGAEGEFSMDSQKI
ncbi:hypothetical protein L7F22_014617 [Adiantum nelumboides]|nr:hypothetical protein [Adiantum nelumboides]